MSDVNSSMEQSGGSSRDMGPSNTPIESTSDIYSSSPLRVKSGASVLDSFSSRDRAANSASLLQAEPPASQQASIQTYGNLLHNSRPSVSRSSVTEAENHVGQASCSSFEDILFSDKQPPAAVPSSRNGPKLSDHSPATPPRGNVSTSSSSSSFHLSLNSSDMPSLNFGDEDQDDELQESQSEAKSSRILSEIDQEGFQSATPSGSVHLLSDTSLAEPATTDPERTATLAHSSFRHSTNDSHRRSLRRSASTIRVQFSPLALAPSPLLGLPSPPPPPALLRNIETSPISLMSKGDAGLNTPSATTHVEELPSTLPKRAILKAPRTPGTGHSVRFSTSPHLQNDLSPNVSARSEFEVYGDQHDCEQEDESVNAESPSASGMPSRPVSARGTISNERSTQVHIEKDDDAEYANGQAHEDESSLQGFLPSQAHESMFGGGGASTFLSKLQAAIPSPNVSLVEEEFESPLLTEAKTPVSAATIEPVTRLQTVASIGIANGNINRGESHDIASSSNSTHATRSSANDSSLSLTTATIAMGLTQNIGGAENLIDNHESSRRNLFDESNPLWTHLDSTTSALYPAFDNVARIGSYKNEEDEEGTSLPSVRIASVPRSGTTDGLGDLDPRIQAETGHETASPPPRYEAQQRIVNQAGADRRSDERTPQAPTEPRLTPETPSMRSYLIAESESIQRVTPRTALASTSPAARTLSISKLDSLDSAPTSTPARQSTCSRTDIQNDESGISLQSPSRNWPAVTRDTTSSSTSSSASVFYRRFLQKRAGESRVAASELDRIASNETSVAATPSTPLVSGDASSDGDEERGEEEDGEEDGTSVYGTPERSRYGTISETASTVFFSPSGLAASGGADLIVADHGDGEGGHDDFEDDSSSAFDIEEQLRSGAEEIQHYTEDTPAEYDDVEHRKLLSPIAEASEPNTTSNSVSPFTNVSSTERTRERHEPLAPRSITSFSPIVPSVHGSCNGALTIFHSTTESRIARPSRSRRGSLSSSLQAVTLNDGEPPNLIQQLLSTQSDYAANALTQKSLLSNLVTNLQNELERKDRMIANLRAQNAETDAAWRGALDDVADFEAQLAERDQDRIRQSVLADVVEKLTTELERRTKADKERARERKSEIERFRIEAVRAREDARDAAIRLRHALASQEDAERAQKEALTQVGDVERELDDVRRQRDEARSRLGHELIERDRVIAALRIELDELKEDGKAKVSSRPAGTSDAEEVERAKGTANKDLDIVKEQLVEYGHAMATLREDHRNVLEELTATKNSAGQERKSLEAALLDAQTMVSRLELEYDAVLQGRESARVALRSVQDRLEVAEVDLSRTKDELRIKDDKLQSQIGASREHQAGVDNLLASIAKMESDALSRANELHQAQDDAARVQRELEILMQDRDDRLAELEASFSLSKTQNETLIQECTRLKESVATLRRQSADRDLKYNKLKKIKNDLEEDIFGLNIALEAKQQEASTWKRQLAAARLIDSATPATAVRSSRLSALRPASAASNSVAATPLPRGTKGASKKPRDARPLSIGSMLDEDLVTPSRGPATASLSQAAERQHESTRRSSSLSAHTQPSMGLKAARREVSDPLPTPRQTRSASSVSSSVPEHKQSSLSRKENVAPVVTHQMMVPA